MPLQLIHQNSALAPPSIAALRGERVNGRPFEKKEVPLRAPNSFDDCRTDKEGKEGGADGAAAENNFLPIPLPPLLPLSGFDVIFFEAIFFCGGSDLTRCTSCTTMRSPRCMHMSAAAFLPAALVCTAFAPLCTSPFHHLSPPTLHRAAVHFPCDQSERGRDDKKKSASQKKYEAGEIQKCRKWNRILFARSSIGLP